mgnify:CR=1 FL=1
MLTSYLFECEEALKEYSLEWNRDINFIISELSGEKKEDDVSKYIYFYVHYKDNNQIIEMNLDELNKSIKNNTN